MHFEGFTVDLVIAMTHRNNLCVKMLVKDLNVNRFLCGNQGQLKTLGNSQKIDNQRNPSIDSRALELNSCDWFRDSE